MSQCRGVRGDLRWVGLGLDSEFRFEPPAGGVHALVNEGSSGTGDISRESDDQLANARRQSLQDIDLDLIARAKVLYVGGYVGLPRLDQESLAALFRFAKEQGLQTVLDVIVPAGRGDCHVDECLAQALPYTDVFLPNDDEGRLLTGEADPIDQAQGFLDYGCPNVVITMGEQGVLAATREQMLRAPSFRVQVVDPSGAGDAFDAGYIYGLLAGWNLERTLTFASAIGASACTKLGCTPGVFTLEEAEVYLARNHLAITEC